MIAHCRSVSIERGIVGNADLGTTTECFLTCVMVILIAKRHHEIRGLARSPMRLGIFAGTKFSTKVESFPCGPSLALQSGISKSSLQRRERTTESRRSSSKSDSWTLCNHISGLDVSSPRSFGYHENRIRSIVVQTMACVGVTIDGLVGSRNTASSRRKESLISISTGR